MAEPKKEFREGMIRATMERRGCGREEAEVILNRIADRLGGYTHAEAVERNPLPAGRDEACGTTKEGRRRGK
jgi:hypothetical protein